MSVHPPLKLLKHLQYLLSDNLKSVITPSQLNADLYRFYNGFTDSFLFGLLPNNSRTSNSSTQ